VVVVAQASHNFITSDSINEISRVHESVQTICDMLERDHMKVVFVGRCVMLESVSASFVFRTSNGKSTTINAMLHTRALPQGIGHTTACFVQLQGTKGNDKYMMTDSNECKSLEVWSGVLRRIIHSFEQNLDAFASALAAERANLGDDALVTVFWPQSDSRLLSNDVVLVDTPGVDVSPEFDKWIDKHCLDADVFVFVANAESTLAQSVRGSLHIR
jgi:mitofusin